TQSGIKVVTHYSDLLDEQEFLSEECLTRLSQGEGLIGQVLQQQGIVHLDRLSREERFLRRKEAAKLKLDHAVCVPVVYGGVSIGLLLFFLRKGESFAITDDDLMNLSLHLAPDLKRKIAEEELNNFFNLSAELLCIIGMDGQFKKVNNAFSRVFDLPEDEVLNTKIHELAHPDDHQEVLRTIKEIKQDKEVVYFESRFLTNQGKTVWLRWSITALKDEGILLGAGHDITERKNLEKLIRQTQEVALMGSWELDLTTNFLFWTQMTKVIHEVAPDYVPNLETAINFYKEGESRELVTRGVQEGMENGTPWDLEVQIITAKGKDKWVRAIGEAEHLNGKCVRLYGSFQDITEKKIKEEELKAS
ncbi:MAG: PAS domain S-box protein, partial [Marinoscillum sp.]